MTSTVFGPDSVRIVVPVQAVATNQTYRTGRGRFFKSPEAEAYRTRLQLAARQAMKGRQPFDDPVVVEIDFVFGSNRPDVDGPIKPTLDALEGHVYANDRQVRALHVYRYVEKNTPCVRIAVTKINEEASP